MVYSITVTASTAPLLTPVIATQTIMYPNVISLSESLAPDSYGNIPNNAIVTATTLPNFVTFLQTGNSVTISIVPLSTTPGGTYPVSLTTTSESGATVSTSFNVKVNTAPTFTTAPAQQNLVVGFPTTYTLPASVDAEGDVITMIVDISLISSFATYSDGIITFIPISESAGTYSVPITLSDNYPSSTSYLLFISVIKATTPKTTGPYTVNTGPPRFIKMLPVIEIFVGESFVETLP